MLRCSPRWRSRRRGRCTPAVVAAGWAHTCRWHVRQAVHCSCSSAGSKIFIVWLQMTRGKCHQSVRGPPLAPAPLPPTHPLLPRFPSYQLLQLDAGIPPVHDPPPGHVHRGRQSFLRRSPRTRQGSSRVEAGDALRWCALPSQGPSAHKGTTFTEDGSGKQLTCSSTC